MTATSHLRKRIKPFDPLAVSTANEMVTALGQCSFQGRSLAYALDVWEAMCRDRKCVRVLSLAGAMVPAGMGLIVIRLLEARLVDAIICTGATMSHDLCNTVDRANQAHYIGDEFADDDELRDESINRIYDTYLPEKGFHSAEQRMLGLYDRITYESESDRRLTISTHSFLRQLGGMVKGNSILTAAAAQEVPIFVPAISDSEMGLNVAAASKAGKTPGGKHIEFDTLADVDAFAALIASKPVSGLVSIGGGVPRNWAQQVYPYLNMKVMDKRVKADGYHYGVRITTDRPEFGGLSGCTISESKSWGKYEKRAVEASVICDATIAFPMLATALLERRKKK